MLSENISDKDWVCVTLLFQLGTFVATGDSFPKIKPRDFILSDLHVLVNCNMCNFSFKVYKMRIKLLNIRKDNKLSQLKYCGKNYINASLHPISYYCQQSCQQQL